MAKKDCRIGIYCSDHGFIHGAEAEELRQAIEKLRDARGRPTCEALTRLLDDIDARDSLAYLEAMESSR